MKFLSELHERISGAAPGYNPRHIEVFVRMQHPNPESLPDAQFRKVVKIAKGRVDVGGVNNAESIAAMFDI